MNNSLFLPSGFPRLPLKNGINRTIGQLKRVTVKFCKSNGSCSGVRSFIENDLLGFAKQNPGVVVYLKPRRHHSPVIVTEYLNGERHYFNAHNFTRDDMNKWMTYFFTRIGNQNMRMRKLQYTAMPSIQGAWNPFTNRDPKLNITSFPTEELSVPEHMPESATERLRKMFERQKLNESEDQKLGEHMKLKVQS